MKKVCRFKYYHSPPPPSHTLRFPPIIWYHVPAQTHISVFLEFVNKMQAKVGARTLIFTINGQTTIKLNKV